VLYQYPQVTLRTPRDDLAKAKVGALRSRFMKVAARIRESCREVRLHLCSSIPYLPRAKCGLNRSRHPSLEHVGFQQTLAVLEKMSFLSEPDRRRIEGENLIGLFDAIDAVAAE
jgi:hypothetical protein